MKKSITVLSSLLLTAALGACSPGINDLNGNRITFDHSGMVVHAPGDPNAHVGADGSLSIGSKPVAVTPAQRELLKSYYGEAQGLMQSGKAVGRAGAEIGVHAITGAVTAVFSGHSDQFDHEMDARTKSIESAASSLCGDVAQLRKTQTAIATQIPAFMPYSLIKGDVKCETSTTIVRGNNSTTKFTTTRTVDEAGNVKTTKQPVSMNH